MMAENVVLKKSYAFALSTVKFCNELQKKEKEYILSRQLLRSATSIGSNLEEAQGAISKSEFISKTQISLKEAIESHYWLRLLRDSKIADSTTIALMIPECTELISILKAILRTAKENQIRKQAESRRMKNEK